MPCTLLRIPHLKLALQRSGLLACAKFDSGNVRSHTLVANFPFRVVDALGYPPGQRGVKEIKALLGLVQKIPSLAKLDASQQVRIIQPTNSTHRPPGPPGRAFVSG
eukprot:8640634-Pyramimonas_sp.AAC.1